MRLLKPSCSQPESLVRLVATVDMVDSHPVLRIDYQVEYPPIANAQPVAVLYVRQLLNLLPKPPWRSSEHLESSDEPFSLSYW